MSVLSRDILARAFPDNPRMRAELEDLDRFLSDAEERVTALLASAEQASARLTALESETLPERLAQVVQLEGIGAVEILAPDHVAVREIDTSDAASLLSRGYGDARYLLYAGKGPTTDRPSLAAEDRAIYFDTTLDADGKPVFWTGGGWVDATGAAA